MLVNQYHFAFASLKLKFYIKDFINLISFPNFIILKFKPIIDLQISYKQ